MTSAIFSSTRKIPFSSLKFIKFVKSLIKHAVISLRVLTGISPLGVGLLDDRSMKKNLFSTLLILER